MDLKELRIMYGLTQTECANLNNMSLRSYQNYENDPSKINTIKYNMIIAVLNNKFNNNILSENVNISYEQGYKTNVLINDDIIKMYQNVKNYKTRYCFNNMLKYFDKDKYLGKVCILYGLRRTGKTTLICQMFNELDINSIAYIKLKKTDSMSNLLMDVDLLVKEGKTNIFLDEITLLDDFIDTCATLSDIYCNMGIKIVLSGTDSLGFVMASNNELYDRNIMIHTSYISFKEYSYLLGINSIDSYIEYGGCLKQENMGFNDIDAFKDDVMFLDDESTRKYIDSAICRNIQHTLKNDSFGGNFDQLKELYLNNELTNIINRIVENINHDFVLKVIEDDYKSQDFGSSKNLLLHDAPNKNAFVLDNVNYKELINRLKKLIEIKDKFECNIEVTTSHIEKIKKYLFALDLLAKVLQINEEKDNEYLYVFTQPGMRYSISKALVYSLMQDSYFNSIPYVDKQYIINKILDDVKGRMLEEIVLLETTKRLDKTYKVFKYKFSIAGEYDMVIYNTIDNTCKLFEIKHSDKINSKQTKYLIDQSKCETISRIYGHITEKVVLYRGKDKTIDVVKYKNVEEFLKELK